MSFQLCCALFIIIIIIIISASADGSFGSFSLNLYSQVVFPITQGFPSLAPWWGRQAEPTTVSTVVTVCSPQVVIIQAARSPTLAVLDPGEGPGHSGPQAVVARQLVGAPSWGVGRRTCSLPREAKQMLGFKNSSLWTVSSVGKTQDRESPLTLLSHRAVSWPDWGPQHLTRCWVGSGRAAPAETAAGPPWGSCLPHLIPSHPRLLPLTLLWPLPWPRFLPTTLAPGLCAPQPGPAFPLGADKAQSAAQWVWDSQRPRHSPWPSQPLLHGHRGYLCPSRSPPRAPTPQQQSSGAQTQTLLSHRG